jgi:competence protein ComGC
MVKRAAFTFIELIFAIVIISVVVMSLPVMSNLLSKGVETNIVQEAIFAAATEINEVTSYHWDDNSVDTNYSRAGVINVDNSCESNTSKQRYRLRPGHILQVYHRQCIQNLALSAADANISKTASVDDVAEALKNALQDSTATSVSTDASGYKDIYKTQVSVEHNVSTLSNIKINNATPTTASADLQDNIKRITVTIWGRDSNGNYTVKLTSLRTYIANIGEVDYYKRSY